MSKAGQKEEKYDPYKQNYKHQPNKTAQQMNIVGDPVMQEYEHHRNSRRGKELQADSSRDIFTKSGTALMGKNTLKVWFLIFHFLIWVIRSEKALTIDYNNNSNDSKLWGIREQPLDRLNRDPRKLKVSFVEVPRYGKKPWVRERAPEVSDIIATGEVRGNRVVSERDSCGKGWENEQVESDERTLQIERGLVDAGVQ